MGQGRRVDEHKEKRCVSTDAKYGEWLPKVYSRKGMSTSSGKGLELSSGGRLCLSPWSLGRLDSGTDLTDTVSISERGIVNSDTVWFQLVTPVARPRCVHLLLDDSRRDDAALCDPFRDAIALDAPRGP